MCFIDLTKAFDRVRLTDVLRILKSRKISPRIVTIIKELNSGNITFIKMENSLNKKILISNGIRQGDSLSSILFNVIMDEIIKETKSAGRGYKLGDAEVKIVCYADDAVVSEEEDNLQRLLHQFEMTAERYNMSISIPKTQTLVIAKEPRKCILAVYDKSVEQVMSFRYLGAHITSNRNLKEEVQKQTVKAAMMAGYLRDIIWRNKYMRLESKVRVYKTCVRPVMTYAIETRAETTKTTHLLRTTEMRILRCITGNTLRDRVRNEDIRDTCKIQNIVRWERVDGSGEERGGTMWREWMTSGW